MVGCTARRAGDRPPYLLAGLLFFQPTAYNSSTSDGEQIGYRKVYY
jgi:hypothetical protein